MFDLLVPKPLDSGMFWKMCILIIITTSLAVMILGPLNYYSLLLFQRKLKIIVNEVISFDSLVGKPTLG